MFNSTNHIKKFLYIAILGIFFFQENCKSETHISNNGLNEIQKLDYKNVETPYLLGPGDILKIKFNGLDYLNGNYVIEQDGTIFLPEINQIFASGYSLEEFKMKILNKYREFIYDPDLFITIQYHRPINVYIAGEVRRPGYYKFSINSYVLETRAKMPTSLSKGISPIERDVPSASTISTGFPRLFDVIQKSKGLTPFADLSNIKVKRNNSIINGGGKIEAKVNLLALIKEGDQSQNIKIFDGDTIVVEKSKNILKNQVLDKSTLQVNKTNINPEKITIFITGNIERRGPQVIKQGSSLLQALSIAGGRKNLSGNIEHIRFNDDGSTLKNSFLYDQKAVINTPKNPVLIEGDIIHIKRNTVGKTTDIIDEIARPIISSYGLYKIFTD